MKKAKKAPRSRRPIPSPQLPPKEPDEVSMRKALKLPMFGPGISITIPLNLLPAYLELYHLQPKGMSANGVLLVKRDAPSWKKPSLKDKES